ncbi:universal stress protein [Rhodoplanes serenus]|uniref:Universal stress protein n=1 Tax=Rhodoplanes serenus TaxID=200615 RepID=A0A9X4XN30_9BRAD|nr:universal stress protein [Rhodoplanes serenus]MTW17692.1 universal stress protein [Rhodoplanes serenus]
MSYATIMVHVGIDDGCDARIRVASGLGERFHATLIGIAAWGPRPPFAAEGMVVDFGPSESETAAMQAELGRLGARFRATLGATNRPVEWRAALDFPVEVVARAARAADLVVVGAGPQPDDSFRALDPGSVVLRAGRPVLTVPAGVDALVPSRVMIAWKDTREARRALADALPFLHEADRVIAVEVCPDGGEDAAQDNLDDLARHLARHRIALAAGITMHADGAAGEALIRVAGEERIDLVVAGGYGHSRLGEWIFGGATRDLLARAPVCCLLSH